MFVAFDGNFNVVHVSSESKSVIIKSVQCTLLYRCGSLIVLIQSYPRGNLYNYLPFLAICLGCKCENLSRGCAFTPSLYVFYCNYVTCVGVTW